MKIPQRVTDRLLANVTRNPLTGCILSNYSVGSHGYSQIGWNITKEVGYKKIKMVLGHRVAWEASNGPIPDGMTIDHKCRVRRCINVDHLQLMGNLENAAGGGGFHVGVPEPLGRLCGKGLHELLRYPSGAVNCRECAMERSRRKDQKRKGV